MNMKEWYSNKLMFLIIVMASCRLAANGTSNDITLTPDSIQKLEYENRLLRREARWIKLLPNIYTLQYAGDVGMFSLGVGWDYGRDDRWETHLQLGFTPKRYKYHTYWTLTLREIYNPWTLKANSTWRFKPLSVNLAINSILHHDFWAQQPDRYPKGYYGFSSRIRFHLGLGQRITVTIPENRRRFSSALSLYYEVSTCDLYVRQKILNKSIPIKDIIALGVGLQWTI